MPQIRAWNWTIYPLAANALAFAVCRFTLPPVARFLNAQTSSQHPNIAIGGRKVLLSWVGQQRRHMNRLALLGQS
jgi:hypothetical protein